MRILLATPIYSPFVSGSARLQRDIVDFLLARGHEAEVLTYGHGIVGDWQAFDNAQGYPIHRVLPQRFKGGSSSAMLTKLVGLGLRRRYDVVLCGYASPTAVLARIARRITRIPYAVYTHGEDITPAKRESRRDALARALREAKVVMANSRYSASEVEEFGVPVARIVVVPPGIDPAPYLVASPDAVEALRHRLGLEGKRVILTLARLVPRKGHDTIIRALPAVAQEVPEVRYLVVGKGDPTAVKELAEAEGVADRVTILEYVADEELPLLFHLCDVYAMVSRWDPNTQEAEGFGIVYLEAAACGKPSLAGSHGGAAEAVTDGETGLVVEPTSTEAVAAALTELLTDRELANRLGAAGKERVLREFDKQVLLARIEECLNRDLSD